MTPPWGRCKRCGWCPPTAALAATHHLFCPSLAAPEAEWFDRPEGVLRSLPAPQSGMSGASRLGGRADVPTQRLSPAGGAARGMTPHPQPKT